MIEDVQMDCKKLIRGEGNHSVESYIVDMDETHLDPEWFDKDDCEKCYGSPCVCEEEKTYKPLQAVYMWFPKENQMILLNDLPLSPRAKRMWDQAIPLK